MNKYYLIRYTTNDNHRYGLFTEKGEAKIGFMYPVHLQNQASSIGIDLEKQIEDNIPKGMVTKVMRQYEYMPGDFNQAYFSEIRKP